MFVFKYEAQKDDVIATLKDNTIANKPFKWLFSDADILFMVLCRRFILLKEKKPYCVHALQRGFVGVIRSTDDGCEIKGFFKYPTVAFCYISMILIIILRLTFTVFIKEFLKTDVLGLLILGGFLLLMYTAITLLFVTGITAFKKQEKDVVELLSHLFE